MALTGDIMCHNTIYSDAFNKQSNTYDFSYLFDDIKYNIQTADIAIGNLETTFAGSSKGYSSYPTFNTPENLAYTLKKLDLMFYLLQIITVMIKDIAELKAQLII